MNRLAMFRAVLALLQKMEASAIPAVQTVVAALIVKVQELVSFADAQLAPTAGATAARRNAITELTELAITLGARLRSFAEAQQRPELAARVRLVPSRFRTQRLELRVAYARMVYDALVPLAGELAQYAVTPELVAELSTKLEAASAALNTPRLPLVERRNATARLAGVFDAIDVLIADQLDPLMQSLRDSEPALYTRYLAARKVINRPGTRERETDVPAMSSGASSTPNAEKVAA